MNNSVVIFLIIDALGFNINSEYDFFNTELPYRFRSKSIFGFSSSAIPSILTGKLPAEHGRWNLIFRSQTTSPFSWTKPFRMLPKFVLEHRVTRKAINEISKKLCGAEGYFSSYGVPARNLYMFDICEKNNIYKIGGIPGSQTIIDYLDQSKVPYQTYSYHDGSDSFLLKSLQEDVAAGEANIFFQYLAEFDSFLHNHCDDPGGIQQKLAWYEDKISVVLNTAKNMGKSVRFFLFSDHGMTPVSRHYDLIADLTGADIDLENHCMSAFDSTMARFWVDDAVVENKIRRVLELCPAGKILSDEELKSLGVYFSDHRYGDLIFLMDPGTLIFPNWFGKYSPKGMHGFHPDDSHTDAVFMSNVGDYAPQSILDFYGIMKREVDLQAGILRNVG